MPFIYNNKTYNTIFVRTERDIELTMLIVERMFKFEHYFNLTDTNMSNFWELIFAYDYIVIGVAEENRMYFDYGKKDENTLVLDLPALYSKEIIKMFKDERINRKVQDRVL